MKIIKIECIPVSLPFAKPMIMSGDAVKWAHSVILKLHTDEGITGISESGDTSVWYMGESQDSILYNICSVYGPRILIGEDPFNIETIIAKMDRAVNSNNHSKSVVDHALHDLIGKALGVPLFKLLGGRTNERVRLAYVMSSGTPDEVAKQAQKLVGAGYKGLKLKVGANIVEDDVEMVAEVRRAVGADIKIMTDANGGWDYFQALRFLRQAAKYDLYLAEQPIPRWDMDGLARLRRKMEVPIFADESAAELNDLHKLAQRDAIDGFFLKIPKAGGIHKSQKWVAIAQSMGLSVMCGCMINSGLGAAVEAHFLTATEWMGRMEQESIGPLNLHNLIDTTGEPLTDDLAVNPPRYENGYLYAPEGNGLGIELNEKAVKKFMTPGKKPFVLTA
ncbi:MAG: mandelate racemase/muconate lactonizing enzyme family protein [Deltaproteobacteria bacterium]|nr:mandelate racemase/muconate lactonizing enzyme family protein [Deltaproteobacteria bacterium]